MSEKNNKTDQITPEEALRFLEMALQRQEIIQLFTKDSEAHRFKVSQISPPRFTLEGNSEITPQFLEGLTYLMQFEVDNVTYSGSAIIDKNDLMLTLQYIGKVKVLNRRSDFRMPPPDHQFYSVLLTEIDNQPFHEKLEFHDLSLGGCKLRLPDGPRKQAFRVGSHVKGHLQFRGDTIPFHALIKSSAPKTLGLQFLKVLTEDNNRLWSELLFWYRQRKNRYAA